MNQELKMSPISNSDCIISNDLHEEKRDYLEKLTDLHKELIISDFKQSSIIEK